MAARLTSLAGCLLARAHTRCAVRRERRVSRTQDAGRVEAPGLGALRASAALQVSCHLVPPGATRCHPVPPVLSAVTRLRPSPSDEPTQQSPKWRLWGGWRYTWVTPSPPAPSDPSDGNSCVTRRPGGSPVIAPRHLIITNWCLARPDSPPMQAHPRRGGEQGQTAGFFVVAQWTCGMSPLLLRMMYFLPCIDSPGRVNHPTG